MNAIEKLTKERESTQSNYEKKVAEAIIKRCRESDALSADVLKPSKTLAECFKYITAQARKQAKNGCAVIEDSKVYEWAEDYYHAKEEPKKEAPKPTQKAEPKVVKFDKNKAIAKATANVPKSATKQAVKATPQKPKTTVTPIVKKPENRANSSDKGLPSFDGMNKPVGDDEQFSFLDLM